MKIYIYDKETNVFLYSKDAQINPLQKGEYIYPKNSTTIVIPPLKEREIAVFNGNYWDIVPDYRGLEQIDVESKEVSLVRNFGNLEDGYMLYSDYVLTPEYKEEQQEKLKSETINEILSQISLTDAKRIRAICEPSVKDADTGETWLDYYNSLIRDLRQKLWEVENDS